MIIYFYFKVNIDSKYIEGKIIKKYFSVRIMELVILSF